MQQRPATHGLLAGRASSPPPPPYSSIYESEVQQPNMYEDYLLAIQLSQQLESNEAQGSGQSNSSSKETSTNEQIIREDYLMALKLFTEWDYIDEGPNYIPESSTANNTFNDEDYARKLQAEFDNEQNQTEMTWLPGPSKTSIDSSSVNQLNTKPRQHSGIENATSFKLSKHDIDDAVIFVSERGIQDIILLTH